MGILIVWMQTYNDSNSHLKSGFDYAILTLNFPISDQYFEKVFLKLYTCPKRYSAAK